MVSAECIPVNGLFEFPIWIFCIIVILSLKMTPVSYIMAGKGARYAAQAIVSDQTARVKYTAACPVAAGVYRLFFRFCAAGGKGKGQG
jgi:hypothetical protein